MSNYGSNTPSGAYQGGSQNYNPQQQGYQAPASNYGQGHKSGGTFGQMMNQAVTTGKPMLDKLGKTLSSKLGNKPAPGPPQHLQSYQNYQNHQNPSGQAQGQSQGYQQQQNQTYSPQPQQQQWQQPQQQPTPPSNSYTPSQPSPYQPNNYGTSTPVQSNPNNYFPQQSPPPLNHALKPPPAPVQSPAPSPQQQPPNAPGYNTSEYGQGQQGQLGQANPAQTQGYFPQGQQDAYNAQQSGVVGANQNPGFQAQPGYPQGPHGPPPTSPPMETPVPPAPQSQWSYNNPDHNPHIAQQQQQPYPPVSNAPFQQEQQQQQHQQWNPMSPMSPAGQPGTSIPPPSVSPPPAQNNAHMPPNNMAHTQPSPPAPQSSVPHSAPTEFIAELPADMGNLKLTESPIGTGAATPASQYQAYNPSGPSASPSKGFSVPRRKVSTSSVPLADPWRFADPVTETPTREFYILADILFDTLDRKFEPQNTGMLEAPKVMGSWIEMSEDARNLFSYNGYTALAHQWSLQGIPHFMVPVQPHLAPMWNFDQQAHAQELKLSQPPSGTSSYATYMPALNRAGWYKFFFLEMCHAPNDIDKLIPALCAETYKPGVLNHPDLSRRDKSEVAILQARATDVQVPAINRVCEEARTAMLLDPNVPASSRAPAGGSSAASGGLQPGSPEDMAVQMHRIQAERQFNDMAVKTVLGAGITFGPAGGYSGGYASLV